MKLKLLLVALMSACCFGASAKIVLKKSVENNMKWESAYVVCQGDTVTYSYVDDTTDKLADNDSLGFLFDDKVIYGNTFSFIVTAQPGETTGLQLLNFAELYEDPNLGLIDDRYDTLVVALRGDVKETWVSTNDNLYIHDDKSFQLINPSGEIIERRNYPENTNNGLRINGPNNILRIFDGKELREYILKTGIDLRLAKDTICEDEDAVFELMLEAEANNGYIRIFDIEEKSFEFNATNSATAISKFPLGENNVRVEVAVYPSTPDFVQKEYREYEFVVNIKQCNQDCNLPELPEVKLAINKDTFCYGEPLYFEVKDWWNISQTDTTVRYKLYLGNDSSGIEAFEYDSISYWDAAPEFSKIKVVRTNGCGRVSTDSINITVIPWLPEIELNVSQNELCIGDTVELVMQNWDEYKKLEKEYNATIRFTLYNGDEYIDDAFRFENTIKVIAKENKYPHPYVVGYLERGGLLCNEVAGFAEYDVKDCNQECIKDTVHIKPVSFDIVQNGVCDFSLVYTLKDSEGCSTYYYIDLDMEDCNGDDTQGIDLVVQNNYVYFNEDTKVSIFSVDGRKVFDGKCDSIKLESGIYIVTTANAYRKVIIK